MWRSLAAFVWIDGDVDVYGSLASLAGEAVTKVGVNALYGSLAK